MEKIHFLSREFVLYLLKTDVHHLNNHWSPYYLHCSPCIANFSVVLKLDSEHYNLEEKFLLQRTNLYKPEMRNVGSTKKILNETYQYFNTLDCNTVRKLYNIYILDFILFEYEPFQFLKECLV